MSEELVPVERTEFDPATMEVDPTRRELLDLLGGRKAIAWCSWKRGTEAERAMFYSARHGESGKLAQQMGKTLHVKGFLLCWGGSDDEDSEGRERYVRTILVLNNGSMLRSGSEGVRDCARDLSAQIGPGPWDDPLVIVPFEIPVGQPAPLQKLQYLGRLSEQGKVKESKNGK